jgi:hypothetical protein
VPSEYAANEWPHQLDEMSDRAKLDHDERRVIEAYLVALARH